jgi:hypothetical protein
MTHHQLRCMLPLQMLATVGPSAPICKILRIQTYATSGTFVAVDLLALLHLTIMHADIAYLLHHKSSISAGETRYL